MEKKDALPTVLWAQPGDKNAERGKLDGVEIVLYTHPGQAKKN